MKREMHFLCVAVVALSVCSVVWAESVSTLLEDGLYTERTVGDLDAAIQIYRKVIAHAEAKADQKAQAQFRIGMCYMRKRQQAQAVEAFKTVIEKYPQQKELVAGARLRLGRLISPNPAALMPPGTMVYAEIGSPGHQVEKIVNMLKGTPLANPLEVLGGGRRPMTAPSGGGRQPMTAPSGTGPRHKTPADIISALLNPSMLAEFKKVRGMAVGVSGVEMRGAKPPPFVAVVFPGESDALRGLLVAALLMAGEKAEPIEGMETVAMEQAGGIACAYDDNVMILAYPKEQLTWCIKQYKGISKEPSLATANRSFAALTSAKGRQSDALTVWVNPPAVFAAVQEQFASGSRGGQMLRQLRAIDAIFDFQNMEGAVVRLVIDERNPYVEAAVAFKDGHECLAYDLIRTPHLSKAGFEAVPAQAVGIVSLALGEAQQGDEKAEARREALRRLTGLDVGREVFANIEQISLFAVPPSDTAGTSVLAEKLSPVVPCFGLAITSRDPQQTRRLLDKLLSIPEMIMSVQDPEEPESREKVPGRYLVWQPGGKKVYCHVGQAGRSTVIALDRRVMAMALAAAESGKGALGSAGPLQPALSELPAGTSKLILINAGGALQLATAHGMAQMPPSVQTQPSVQKQMDALSQLTKALAETNLQVHSVETPNRLTVRLGVSNLPPLGELFSAVMMMR